MPLSKPMDKIDVSNCSYELISSTTKPRRKAGFLIFINFYLQSYKILSIPPMYPHVLFEGTELKNASFEGLNDNGKPFELYFACGAALFIL
jgi:hypothetical protein